MSQALLNEWNCFFANNPIRIYLDCSIDEESGIRKFYDLLHFDFEGIFLTNPSENPELKARIFERYQNDGSLGLNWLIFADFMLEELILNEPKLNLLAQEELAILSAAYQLARRWELFSTPQNAGQFRDEYLILAEKILLRRMEVYFARDRYSSEDFEQTFWLYDGLMNDYLDKMLTGEKGFGSAKVLSKISVFGRIARRAKLFSDNRNFMIIANRTLSRFVNSKQNVSLAKS
ncbi:MAG: hypothetical protein Q4A27_01835 [bacterium]|nr:hypothetical protein [bacterium]